MLRGFNGRNRTLVLLDGEPINESFYGQVPWNIIPLGPALQLLLGGDMEGWSTIWWWFWCGGLWVSDERHFLRNYISSRALGTSGIERNGESLCGVPAIRVRRDWSETKSRIESFLHDTENNTVPLGIHAARVLPPKSAQREGLSEFTKYNFEGSEAAQFGPDL
jgi:hypothetical protein